MNARRLLPKLALLPVILLLLGGEPFTAPGGDLNVDGSVDVIDIQCLVLVFEQTVLGDSGVDISCENNGDCIQNFGANYYCREGFEPQTICLPICLDQSVSLGAAQAADCDDPEQENDQCLGVTPKLNTDLNCDGEIGNQDLNFVIAISTGKIGGPGTADYDEDGKLNFCDEDSDSDGTDDAIDCAPLNPQMAGSGEEICNGQDDDCDGEIDEGLDTVECGLGKCAHEQVGCVDGVPMECDPFEGAGDEVCNGQDEDCDGEIDNDLGVTECGLGVCKHEQENCINGVPQVCNPFQGAGAEVCNGLDDDCDGQIDEELGTKVCGVWPCEVIIDVCKNGVPQDCTGQGIPQTETCDGKDNDCDGEIDEEDSLGCSLYYADKDNDGWGADNDFKCLCESDWVYDKFSGGDCYDDNYSAKPYNMSWYKQDRGDGSFDYNCDGSETLQFPDLFYCNGQCNYSTPGWYLFPPMCGTDGLYATVCLYFYICDIKSVTMTAACH